MGVGGLGVACQASARLLPRLSHRAVPGVQGAPQRTQCLQPGLGGPPCVAYRLPEPTLGGHLPGPAVFPRGEAWP